MHFTPSTEFTPNPRMKDAACRNLSEKDKQVFFGTNNSYMKAKAICAECPVRVECLERALSFEADGRQRDRFGVWGGLTAPERQRLESGDDREESAGQGQALLSDYLPEESAGRWAV